MARQRKVVLEMHLPVLRVEKRRLPLPDVIKTRRQVLVDTLRLVLIFVAALVTGWLLYTN